MPGIGGVIRGSEAAVMTRNQDFPALKLGNSILRLPTRSRGHLRTWVQR